MPFNRQISCLLKRTEGAMKEKVEPGIGIFLRCYSAYASGQGLPGRTKHQNMEAAAEIVVDGQVGHANCTILFYASDEK